MRTPEPIDLVFLVALDEEFRILRDRVGAWTPVRNAAYECDDYRFSVEAEGRGKYSCVACLIDDMGPGHAGDATHRVLSAWEPVVIANIGIAASLHRTDVRIGDVVVVSSANEYSARTKVRDAEDGPNIQHGGEYYRVDPRLINAVRQFEFSEHGKFVEWRDMCSRRCVADIPSEIRDPLISQKILRLEPAISKCDLASGPAVGASEEFKTWLTSANRNLKALEMEAAGILRAIVSKPTTARALVLRGISDFADGNKTELDSIQEGAFRRLAMQNAIDLVWALMESGRLPRSGETAEPSTSREAAPPSTELERLKAGIVDPNVSVTQLARLALAYARGIGDRDFSEWLEQEIKGYFDGKKLPDYRTVGVESRAHLRDIAKEVSNHPVPLQSLEFEIRNSSKIPHKEREELADMVREMGVLPIRFGLAEVEEYARGDAGKIPWPDQLAHLAMPFITHMNVVHVWQRVPPAAFTRVLNGVRSRIFDHLYPGTPAGKSKRSSSTRTLRGWMELWRKKLGL